MLIKNARIKILGILTLIGLLVYACRPGSDQLTREVIMHYCDLHYRRYQPIDFEKAKEYYIPFDRSKQYADLNIRKKRLQHQHDSLRLKIATENKPEYLITSTHIDSGLSGVEKQLALSRQNYKPERNGWMVVHSYNHQPAGSPMVRNTTIFIVSNDLKRVLEVYDK